MTVIGLETILKKDCLNYEPGMLHNTRVVVNGLDFAGEVYDQMEHTSGAYGGEYLAFYIKLKEVLAAFGRCKLTAYFLFPGVSSFRGLRLQSKLRKNLLSLVSSRSATQLPACLKNVVTETLHETGLPFQVTSRPILCSVAALADYLNCPLLASSSDFYILANSDHLKNKLNSSSPRSYVSLHYCSLDPISDGCPSASIENSMLSVHTFRAERSELKSMTPANRILAALLLGTDTMPYSVLPHEVQRICDSQDSSLPAKERRWRAVVGWLSSFSAGPEEPLKHLIASVAEDEKQHFINQLFECVTGYIYHPDTDGARLFAQFQQNDISSIDDISKIFDQSMLENSSVVEQDIISLLKGEKNQHLQFNDFTIGWPVRLVQAYRSCKILCSLLSPLYSSGLVLSITKEDDTSELPVYESSLPLRLMHYRIMLELERQLGCCAKVIGLSPCAIEYVRRDKRIVAYMIPVAPFRINLDHEHTDRVLSSFLGTTLPSCPPEPEWIFGLAVTVAFWHRGLPSDYRVESLDCCSVVLAVLACAVVGQSDMFVPVALYNNFKELLHSWDKEQRSIGDLEPEKSSFKPSHLKIVHHFAAIQLVYISLHSLVNLLESILPFTHESQLFHFPPVWSIFPSGQVVYTIAVHLESEDPMARCRVVTNYWIPRLLHQNQTSRESQQILRSSISTFHRLLRTALSLQLPPHHIEYTISDVRVPLFPPFPTNKSPTFPSRGCAYGGHRKSPFRRTLINVTNNVDFSERSPSSKDTDGPQVVEHETNHPTYHTKPTYPVTDEPRPFLSVTANKESTATPFQRPFRGRVSRGRGNFSYANRLLRRLGDRE